MESALVELVEALTWLLIGNYIFFMIVALAIVRVLRHVSTPKTEYLVYNTILTLGFLWITGLVLTLYIFINILINHALSLL